jgi:hypothetical protein
VFLTEAKPVMNIFRHRTLFLFFTVACVALPAHGAERMRAGQWDGTWTGGGRTRATSNCISPADAVAINGDAKAIRGYLEQIIPPAICTLSDIKVSGDKVTYTSLCTGAKENVITTTYHGDSFESVDSSGNTSVAKRTGACK